MLSDQEPAFRTITHPPCRGSHALRIDGSLSSVHRVGGLLSWVMA
jgi:hypothetical protein